MPFYFLKQGDPFTAAKRADAIVIPVNTFGGAGAGVAAKAREVYPASYFGYREWCRVKGPIPGDLYAFQRAQNVKPRYIVHLATKAHWKHPSEIAWIRRGLKRLRSWAQEREEVEEIAIPALGCGTGQLAWEDVRPVLVEVLKDAPFAAIVLEPKTKEPE